MAFDLGTWPMTAWTFERSHIISINQVWFKRTSTFKWGHFHIFSLSYNLTSDDLWPWYMNFDLINKWGFPCCIYDPILVEIHQSMWKLEPNVNPFLNRQQQQQTTTTTVDKVIPEREIPTTYLSCGKTSFWSELNSLRDDARNSPHQYWELHTRINKVQVCSRNCGVSITHGCMKSDLHMSIFNALWRVPGSEAALFVTPKRVSKRYAW